MEKKLLIFVFIVPFIIHAMDAYLNQELIKTYWPTSSAPQFYVEGAISEGKLETPLVDLLRNEDYTAEMTNEVFPNGALFTSKKEEKKETKEMADLATRELTKIVAASARRIYVPGNVVNTDFAEFLKKLGYAQVGTKPLMYRKKIHGGSTCIWLSAFYYKNAKSFGRE